MKKQTAGRDSLGAFASTFADEIAEIITHLAFYIGWPNAWATFNLAKEVWVD